MSNYTYAKLAARIGILMQKTDPNDAPVPKEAWAACLRYFADAEAVARLVTLTTTPDGQIHVRLTSEERGIFDLYF